MSPQPIIFISAVSKELSTAREAVAQVLRTLGYSVDYQPDFGTEHGDIREMLRRRIEPCEGVIQLVGQRYGFEPPAADETHGRVSYTQYEALHARSLPKKVWYLLLDETFHSETKELQTPEETELQQAYRTRVLKDTHVYHHIPDLTSLKLKVHEMKNELEVLRVDWLQHRQRIENGVSKIEQMLVEQTAPGRLAAYKRSLLSAFRPYQELGIDDYERGEKETSDIRDIFVHPACSIEHLRPEDMDVAQRETPPRLPAQDLLPLLAQDNYRRTVLLADPGMGKSTLIQSLIAHLASGRSFTGAAALTGLLPVPIILRDIVPLLPKDHVESWNWNDILSVLTEHYQREETAPPLCDCFKDHRNEFHQLIHTDEKVFFLIDGLDEIGDLAMRRQIVECLHEGIRAANKGARWLITSRVIGYEDAPMDYVERSKQVPNKEIVFNAVLGSFDSSTQKLIEVHRKLRSEMETVWHDYIVHSVHRKWFKEGLIPEVSNLISDSPSETRLAAPDTGFKIWACVSIAQRLHLAPFDDKRQDIFSQRWFQQRHSTDYSHELMREVRAHHHDGVRIISRVPNLLCMMNILKRSGKPLPDGRAALYDGIVQAYLGGIDSAYRLRPVLGNICPFDTSQRRFLLSLLGAEMQDTRTFLVALHQNERESGTFPDALHQGERESKFDGNILISRLNIEKLLSPVIHSMLVAGKVQSTHSTDELLNELLHHIASRSGLLIPRSSDEAGHTLYGFTHLSFLEFFAAEWLGLEFDRRQRQLARRSEAQLDDVELSKEELETLFPPHGSIEHSRESFRDLPAIPAWHEPLIFLLESRKADTSTLLRWLFPTLHSQQPHIVSKEDQNPKPLLPLDAVQLAVNLAQDPEIPLTTETRQQWWRRLWFAYLTWPFHPAAGEKSTQWPIAPILINRNEHRTEVVQSLIEVYSSTELTALPELPPEQKGSQAAERNLILFDCAHLTTSDLSQLTVLSHLKRLLLNNCVGLESLPDLSNLKKLSSLYLVNCSGLHGENAFDALSLLNQLKLLVISNCPGLTRLPDLSANEDLEILDLRNNTGLLGSDAVSGLARLAELFHLNLTGCTGLKRLPDLRALQCLQDLKLNDCAGLHGPDALHGLNELTQLRKIHLYGCKGLTNEDVAWLREKLGNKCEIIGQ